LARPLAHILLSGIIDRQLDVAQVARGQKVRCIYKIGVKLIGHFDGSLLAMEKLVSQLGIFSD